MTEPIDANWFSLYSRQFYVVGEKAMKRIGHAQVFISGIGGLGVEIAKCVALAGVKRLTLHDNKSASLLDLSTQYFLSPEKIGQNRADASAPQIAELNPFVTVDVSNIDLKGDLSPLKSYQCIVVTEATHDTLLVLNRFCRENDIRFIAGDVRGVFGWGFVDFGKNFEVFDKNGEFDKEMYIGNITQDKEAVVSCLKGEGERHDFEDGDAVVFREIKGMTPLCEKTEDGEDRAFKVTVLNPREFKINVDTTQFPAYISGGIATEKKIPVHHSFKDLQQALEEPEFSMVDGSKFGNPEQLHLGFQALYKYLEKEGSLPRPWNREDAKKFLDLCTEINNNAKNKVSNLDEKLLSNLAMTSQGSLLPLTAAIGGHLGQEVLKGITGKFTPLKEWLYLDAAELIVEQDESNYQPINSRYDSQIISIGKKATDKLHECSLFMIGAGAIGCEMIKNYALLGVATSEKAKITVTDNDNIEKSNLNRQFLFRDRDINSPKSTTAANAAKKMNPELNIDAHLDKVGPQSEDRYTNEFFKSNTVIVNALDNVEARMYVDKRCVAVGRPLLESGTMGTKGHIQVILPHKTETYGDRIDPPEEGVPFCTIKSFPAKIEHTIQWARDKFESLFVIKPRELEKALRHPENYISNIQGSSGPSLALLTYINKLLKTPYKSFDQCIAFARQKFESFYTNSALQLLHNFPIDKKLPDGSEFWRLPKRPPTPLKFDPTIPSHYDFVYNTACLLASIYNVEVDKNVWTKEKVIEESKKVEVPKFVPKDKTIVTDEKATKQEKKVDVNSYEETVEELKRLISSKVETLNTKVNVSDFEKDDDTNHHVDFINACSNLRAENYGISPVDKMETKRVAGRIIPAISTTTASVSGLVALELIKVVLDLPVESFRNTFLNLALPLYSRSEPGPPAKIPLGGTAFYTVWDHWTIEEPEMTLQELCDHYKKNKGLTVTAVFKDVITIYTSSIFMYKKRMPKKIKELLGNNATGDSIDLTVCFEDENGEEVKGPTVRFMLK